MSSLSSLAGYSVLGCGELDERVKVGPALCDRYFAIPWQGGGGPFLVNPLKKTGKIEPTPFLFQGHAGAVLDVDFSPFDSEVRSPPRTHGPGGLRASASECAALSFVPMVACQCLLWCVVCVPFQVIASASEDSLLRVWNFKSYVDAGKGLILQVPQPLCILACLCEAFVRGAFICDALRARALHVSLCACACTCVRV